MVCRIIWADRVVPIGAAAAMSYEEVNIVTMEKTCMKSVCRGQSSKADPMGRIPPYQKYNGQALEQRIMLKID